MPEVPIVIVGGGAAGLTTAGALKQKGQDAVILDKDDQIGGTWTRRYDRLHLHSVRRFSGLAHYPIPRHFPSYVPKDMFAQYLQDYAQHFSLKVYGGCPVEKVRTAEDGVGWEVVTPGDTWNCKIVVIATGQYGSPCLPDWPGIADFQGKVIHSVNYKSGRDFSGKRVLVIGSGNSGSEIAADLAEQGAAFVANSIRTPSLVVPREFLGTPAQVFGIVLTPVPARIGDQIGMVLSRLALGNLKRYGLKPPQWHPFAASRVPILDVGFVGELKRGHIHVRPNVDRFTPTGAVYQDGSEEAFDVVIAATGFKTGLAELLDVADVVDDEGYPRFRSGQPTPHPGLYFMGYTESIRGHLFEANRDSRRLAELIVRYLSSTTA
jgi:putative flavoprotein involved in K+ transport